MMVFKCYGKFFIGPYEFLHEVVGASELKVDSNDVFFFVKSCTEVFWEKRGPKISFFKCYNKLVP